VSAGTHGAAEPRDSSGSVLVEALVALTLLALAGAAVAAAALAGLRGVRRAAIVERMVALAARDLAVLAATPPEPGTQSARLVAPGLDAGVTHATTVVAPGLVEHVVALEAGTPPATVELGTRRLVDP
jgi:hypothetical protein